MEPAFSLRRIDFGVQGVETDTNSSRFREYRDVPTGIVIPFARFAGGREVPLRRHRGERAAERRALPGASRSPAPSASRRSSSRSRTASATPARTLLEDTGPGVLSISPTLRQDLPERDRAAVRGQPGRRELHVPEQPGEPFPGRRRAHRPRPPARAGAGGDAPHPRQAARRPRSLYFQEKRRGTRAAGTSFGFGNVVESPEPIDYRTRDFGATAEWTRKSLLLRGAFHYNDFANAIPFQSFDNPFRATDATDPNAYQAPASELDRRRGLRARVAGPGQQGDHRLGGLPLQVRQADAPERGRHPRPVERRTIAFMPFTTNTAITTPVSATDLSSLPARSLDGKIRTFSFSSLFTTRPVEHLNLTARLRRYDLRNDTPRIALPGRVRAVRRGLGGHPAHQRALRQHHRRPHRLRRLRLRPREPRGGLSVRQVGPHLPGDGEHEPERGVPEGRPAAVADWVVVRASFEKGTRDFSGLDIEQQRTRLVPRAGRARQPAGRPLRDRLPGRDGLQPALRPVEEGPRPLRSLCRAVSRAARRA